MNGGAWVSTLAPLLGVCVTIATTVWYRLSSKAGREIRSLRSQLEASLRYIFKLLLLLAASGVPKSKIPPAPRELAEADVWRDWTGNDDGGNPDD